MRKSQSFGEELPHLLAHHLVQLNRGSAISIDVIKERGYRSVLGKKELANLGFSKAQYRIPAQKDGIYLG